MQAGAQFWKIGAVKTVLFVYFPDLSHFIKRSATKTLKIEKFSPECAFGPRRRSPNRLLKKSEKHRKIENVEIGALACIITRSRKAIIRRKCVWATPAQSKRVRKKPV